VEVGQKWGYINKRGKIVIQPQFDRAMAFSKGKTMVAIGDKWIMIDKRGKQIGKQEIPFKPN
jgi:hypothetical protein